MAAGFYLGIGAPRSGTTWLYRNLRAASDLYLPPVKELRYFNGSRDPQEKSAQAKRMEADPACSPEDREFLRCWQVTPDGDLDLYGLMFPERPKVGEISPIYSILNAREIGDIKSALTGFDTRVFYLMRNPFFRDLSHIIFSMHRQKNRLEPYRTEEYLQFISTKNFQRRSNYQRNVRVWRSHFGKALSVYYFDDLETAPKVFFKKFAAEMGLEIDPSKVTGLKENKSGRDGAFALALPTAVLQHLRERHLPEIDASKSIATRFKAKWQAEIEAYFQAAEPVA